MKEETKKYTEANRKAWNEAMPKHRKVMNEKWDKMLSDSEFIFQKDEELEELNEIEIKKKRIAHLSCNNGFELMSLKRMGAGRCVGFDISDKAIKDAKTRAEKFNIDCEFIRTDVFDISEKYFNSFDLVYITVGTLVWIPDLKGYFQKAAQLLVENGILFVYEHHPFANVLPYDNEIEDHLRVIHNYFNDEIYVGKGGIDYYENTTYDSSPAYEFSYTISDLINAIIENGFYLTLFNEYEKDIALVYEYLEKSDLELPLSYILTAKKIVE
ncbi:MAG: class I SAM-dependent methyltransferase [Candidatus Cloacimonetes bacterium]|nr:class I SAM-dependent methyltransferase [Candidatus Cloacimonadota bacterium]